MKKIIVMVIVVAVMVNLAIGVGIMVEYDRTHYTAYVYTKGEPFDTGMTKGFNWVKTGETISYSLDELRELASECLRVSWLVNGDRSAIGLTISDDEALIVPGLTLDDKISDTYYLTLI